MTLAHGSRSGAAGLCGISREGMRSDLEWLVSKIGVSSGYLVRLLVSFFGADEASTLFNRILMGETEPVCA
jgi:hypothetical protein